MDFLNSIPWLTVHVTAVTLTLIIVVIADVHGLLWLLGKKETLPKARMEFFHKLVWFGLGVTLFAGFMMFKSYPDYLLSLSAFRFKLLFVALLVINAFFIGKHVQLVSQMPFRDVSPAKKKALLMSGAVSTLCWIGAYTMALLL